MAFHVACPITCKQICFCTLGFPQKLQSEKARDEFLEEVSRVNDFLNDPWGCVRVGERGGTVQVAVPKVVKPLPPPPPVVVGDGSGIGIGGGGDGDELLSAQTKRVAMQKKAAVASMAAEDFARRFESGELADASGEIVGEEQGQSNANVMCRMCFYGENEGSERARKMLSCKSCGKKYHRSCLKTWSQHRDLFHWSSWTCPSCRICEVCRRTGDPNKFMFCKRCDGAYHCYCQHPPHKNVSAGPYLCPKHTRCHSCGSNVPGNGLSVRWFLGYTCCDACGRLFVKGNYCPVCLKVYRDSESTPMVCCDVCQRWVHCQCDSISDEKYLQFQVDNNLQYKCATCRGECYQVKDLEDAVKELWRRRDITDADLIASLRAAAGLPTQEEIFSISPYSDDEENGPIVLKNEFGRSLKFSVKGLVDKSPKKSKEYGKKSSNKKHMKKKEYLTSVIDKSESRQGLDMGSEGPAIFSSPVTGSLSHTEGICSMNQPGMLKHKFVDEGVAKSSEERTPRAFQTKSSEERTPGVFQTKSSEERTPGVFQTKSSNKVPHSSVDIVEDTGKQASKSKTMKGPKIVITLGARNKKLSNSPRSDASSCQREQELTTSNGSEGTSRQRMSDNHMADRHDYSSQIKGFKDGAREGKFGKTMSESFDLNPKFEPYESAPPENMRVLPLKKRSEGTMVGVKEVSSSKVVDKVSSRKHLEGNTNDHIRTQPSSVTQSLPKDSKPTLKLKFKKPHVENPSSFSSRVAPPPPPPPQGEEEERGFVKGQRSKRKRPSTLKDDEDFSNVEEDNSMDEIMDANWILKKLGKDAIGKRVEVHQPVDNSWHKGMVVDIIEGTSILSVDLDDGRSRTVELGRQGIRFVSKQKRPRT